MIKKYLSFLFLLIILNSCGYTPLYSNLKNHDLSLTINNIQGNDEINKLIVRNINSYNKAKSENNFQINLSSKFNKVVLSSNAAGQITNYRLELEVITEILNKKIINPIILTEKFDIKKESSLFDERNYENIVKRDMAKNISNKLDDNPNAEMIMTREVFDLIALRETNMAIEIAKGNIKIGGNPLAVLNIFRRLDNYDPFFNIVTP